MKNFKEGLFTMFGMLTGMVVFGEIYKFLTKTTTEKCKGEEVKVEEKTE